MAHKHPNKTYINPLGTWKKAKLVKAEHIPVSFMIIGIKTEYNNHTHAMLQIIISLYR